MSKYISVDVGLMETEILLRVETSYGRVSRRLEAIKFPLMFNRLGDTLMDHAKVHCCTEIRVLNSCNSSPGYQDTLVSYLTGKGFHIWRERKLPANSPAIDDLVAPTFSFPPRPLFPWAVFDEIVETTNKQWAPKKPTLEERVAKLEHRVALQEAVKETRPPVSTASCPVGGMNQIKGNVIKPGTDALELQIFSDGSALLVRPGRSSSEPAVRYLRIYDYERAAGILRELGTKTLTLKRKLGRGNQKPVMDVLTRWLTGLINEHAPVMTITSDPGFAE